MCRVGFIICVVWWIWVMGNVGLIWMCLVILFWVLLIRLMVSGFVCVRLIGMMCVGLSVVS